MQPDPQMVQVIFDPHVVAAIVLLAVVVVVLLAMVAIPIKERK